MGDEALREREPQQDSIDGGGTANGWWEIHSGHVQSSTKIRISTMCVWSKFRQWRRCWCPLQEVKLPASMLGDATFFSMFIHSWLWSTYIQLLYMLYIQLFSPWICGYVHPGSSGQIANPVANPLRIPGKWAYDLEVAQLEGWMWPGFVREKSSLNMVLLLIWGCQCHFLPWLSVIRAVFHCSRMMGEKNDCEFPWEFWVRMDTNKRML